MTSDGQGSLAQRLAGIDEVECVTPDLNGVPRGKVMTAAGFLEGRRLQMARGVLLQCIMGGYPESRFYGSEDGDLALVPDLTRLYRLPWSQLPRALAICDADELNGESSRLSTRGQHFGAFEVELGSVQLRLCVLVISQCRVGNVARVIAVGRSRSR